MVAPDEIAAVEAMPGNGTGALLEYTAHAGVGGVSSHSVMREGKDHDVTITEAAMVGRLVEHGRGRTRRSAQHAASRALLSSLRALDADELVFFLFSYDLRLNEPG